MSNVLKMSTITLKPEKDLCRCCHSEGSFKSLYTSYFWLDVEKVVYADVLRECLNIELVEMQEPLQHVLCTICYTCIQRLEDAVKFKRQIQKCEKRFLDVYAGCVNKDQTFEVTIKEEIVDREEGIPFEPDSCHNGGDTNSSRLADDGHDADDYQSFYKDDMHSLPDEEDFPKQISKLSKKNKTLAKVKKKKVGKKAKAVKEEHVFETIEGIKVKGPTVKRGVDFNTTDDGFQCLKCPLTVKTANGIRDHVRSVHLNIPKHQCPSCSKTFATVATFTKHKLEAHDIDDRYKCNACNNAFNTKIQLKKHKNTFHMLGVKIKCEQCDYETFSVESLYKHKFKHKTVKDYHCKYCRKAFVRKTTLQLHERIHTGDRRKVCAVCGQAFVQKASLNYHMTKYHPEVAF